LLTQIDRKTKKTLIAGLHERFKSMEGEEGDERSAEARCDFQQVWQASIRLGVIDPAQYKD